VGLSNSQGGAINLGWVAEATISDTLFYSCVSNTGSFGYGGAIYRTTASGWLNLYRCCAFDCNAGDFGNFIYAQGASGLLVSLLETSMVDCGVNAGNYVDGGIYLMSPSGLEMNYFNASSCTSGYSGSVWTCAPGVNLAIHFSLGYMNILECSGSGSIGDQSLCESDSSIRYSNFYKNSPSSSKGVVIHTANRGVSLAVQYCIFSGTLNNALELALMSSSGKFSVSSCVFSGTYSRDHCMDSGGNRENTNTESYRLNVINTHGCSGINAASRSPARSVTPLASPAESPIPTDMATVTPTLLFTSRIRFTPKRLFYHSFMLFARY
jgi:hypothetical protein